jgi:U3 small nucleolar RNA-associated protein 20
MPGTMTVVDMAAPSPDAVSVAPSRIKKAAKTTTSKAHRFESFSKRISRLKIDPLHRVTRERPVEQDSALSTSHFRSALNHWNEFNLTRNFTEFSRKVNSLSESLPQLLHHADTIHDLLVAYIRKGDELSLEPLLDLVAQFAHDLGQHFEKYFSPVVTVVLSVAATHEAPEAIEWSFSCLTWIFKFLSKLLVPDLRPLLSILSPYLGKSRQKAYVARFAAESVAFLLRKAAAIYAKKRAPLTDAVSYLLQDVDGLNDERDLQTYQTALMTLFSEATKGVDGGIHSSGPDLLRCLLEHVALGHDLKERHLQVLEGYLIDVIHHSDAQGFQPLVSVLEEHAMQVDDQTPACHLSTTIRLMLVVVGTRKGSRVRSWTSVSQALVRLSQPISRLGDSTVATQQDLLVTIAMTMQYAPMNELLPASTSLADIVASTSNAQYFLSFCHFFNSIGPQRFRSLFLPRLQQFITARWKDDQVGLCLLLDALHTGGTIGPRAIGVGYVACPVEWETSILDQFARNLLDGHLEFNIQLDAFAKLADCTDFPHDSSSLALLQYNLHQSLVRALDHKIPLTEARRLFALGRGFHTYMQLTGRLSAQGTLDKSLVPLLCRASDPALSLLPFLQGFSEFLEAASASVDLANNCFDSLRARLINNLSSPNAEIRVASLKLLKQTTAPADTWARTTIDLALEIQGTPYNLENVRRLSMYLRRLPRLQEESAAYPKWRRMIPLLCFGLLSTFPGQTAEDVCLAIAEICNDSGDEVVANVIHQWLRSPISRQPLLPTSDNGESSYPHPTSFQCSNVLRIRALLLRVTELYKNATEGARADFEKVHHVELHAVPRTARSLALRVLNAAPAFAEKRSRLFIPIFLASHTPGDTRLLTDDSVESSSSHTVTPEVPETSWAYADRKAFLELIGKFTNPRVLYRSNDVHEVLLGLLANGSSEIQALALKALFTWKHPSIRPYEERLLRLLDEKTFRDELAIVFHADQEQSSIDSSHRAELLPILLRLLFGQMVSHSESHGGQESKRKAILRSLFRLSVDEVSQFLRVALGTLADISLKQNGVVVKDFASYDVMPLDRQYGFLKMVGSMMDTLQSQILPYGDAIINPVLYCTVRGCRHIEDPTTERPGGPLARSIRKVGLHCLDMLFLHCKNIEWPLYLPLIFREIIMPRMATFAIETAQGVSGLLQLFSTWSASMDSLSYLHDYDNTLLDIVFECLTVPSAKDEVKIFVLEQIVHNIARLASTNPIGPNPAADVLKAHMANLARHLIKLLEGKPSRKVLDHTVEVLANLANLVQSSADASFLLRSLILVLTEPTERISPWTKGNLLKSIRQLLLPHIANMEADLLTQVYETVTPLFNYFKDAGNRTVLAELVHVLSSDDTCLHDIAKICSDLNAYSSTKLGEVDFDLRLQAFETVRGLNLALITPLRYQPVLYNLLYFARTDDDFAIRSNAVSNLRHFIKTCRPMDSPGFQELINAVLLPALKKGVKENSETIRADHVALFGLLVEYHQDSTQLADMNGLLVGHDEEASFFNNILHIQSQRRQRAMRRLADEAEKGALRSSNICTFFLPLLEKFIFDGDPDEAANNLKGQAIIATGTLLRWVEWNQFKAIFRRYKGYLDTRKDADKDVAKLLGVAADALTDAAEHAIAVPIVSDGHDTSKTGPSLSRSLPSDAKIADELAKNFIPALTAFVHHKDESQMSLRLPVAVTAVKLMKLLPEDQMSQALPPVLLDLSYVLRSRVQDSRDTARRTLSEVATILGPSCLEYILNELRTSLARGYQLHVLSYTVHAILKSVEPTLSPGDLDYCLHSLVSVVMDDIFGTVGQEKDNEDYVSQMKEVKSNKSLDTMEMLARNATVRNLVKLVRPMQALLAGTLNSKQSKQVDDLLLRIGRGLSGNPSAGSRDMLIFSYEVISDLYREILPPDPETTTNDERNRQRFLVQLSAANKTTRGTNSPLLYKLAKFALDVISLTLKRHDNLRTPENVHGFLPVIGDALMQAPEEVKVSALRLLSTVMNLPMPELDHNAPVYVLEAINIIKNATNTNSELAQAALKVVTAILRERKTVKLRDTDVSYLLHRITPDLEEPSRQGVTFNFIKAIMARRLVLPEVYDVADKIGAIMVTNDGRTVRDTARGIYVHFLLQYPQQEARWAKQVKFLIKNLDYKYAEGRQSVMEAANTILTKTDSQVTQELIESLFMPVVLLMSNDDESKCREMAGALLGRIFQKARKEKLKSLLGPVRSWTEQSEKPALTALGMQAYRICVELQVVDSKEDLSLLLTCVYRALLLEDEDKNDEHWTMIYHALQLFASVTSKHPSLAMSSAASKLWSVIIELVPHSHPWVQNSAANLVGLWFTDIAKQHGRDGYDVLPLAASQGLLLDADAMTPLLRYSVGVLRRNLLSQDLSRQTSLNLTFLGRCFNSNGMLIDIRSKQNRKSGEVSEQGTDSDLEEESPIKPSSIPALHYLLHQLTSILRHEPPRLTVQTLLPKQSALDILAALIPHITISTLLPTLNSILTPLHHLTDPSIPAPHNPSEDFQNAYAALTASAEEVLQAIQKLVGDSEYVRARAEVSRQVRERREDRRTKRRIGRVAEPEKAARDKKRRNERKVVVRKERAAEGRGRRRGW